jgi:hypothetical protein
MAESRKVYYVQNKQTSKILNQKGGWSLHTSSYKVAVFESEEAATAAFPDGVACVIIERNAPREVSDAG